MSIKNINDVVDNLDEIQGNIESMLDESYESAGIAYELANYVVNSNLKNYLEGFTKLADLCAELYDKIGELQAVADGLQDGIENETAKEQAE